MTTKAPLAFKEPGPQEPAPQPCLAPYRAARRFRRPSSACSGKGDSAVRNELL